ncbi:hypothetical protein [Vineibacter terrae]|uniref:hypothetical protein n=1 Tax=Vineibacter terrae TaxID=2586908 RepID=UPI002E310181|nr:hypothetical protein [Vineibacter terrae]HEX2886795.1 hypothetical protein [Vineibacter terrae]
MPDTLPRLLADPHVAAAVRTTPGHMRSGITILLGPWPQSDAGRQLADEAGQLAALLRDAARAIDLALAAGDRTALGLALDAVTDCGQVAFAGVARISTTR